VSSVVNRCLSFAVLMALLILTAPGCHCAPQEVPGSVPVSLNPPVHHWQFAAEHVRNAQVTAVVGRLESGADGTRRAVTIPALGLRQQYHCRIVCRYEETELKSEIFELEMALNFALSQHQASRGRDLGAKSQQPRIVRRLRLW